MLRGDYESALGEAEVGFADGLHGPPNCLYDSVILGHGRGNHVGHVVGCTTVYDPIRSARRTRG